MRVTVYFLVRLITLYGLSAAAVQNRHYPDVLELNQIYDRFDPKELEAAYSITPIDHPVAEPSKHLTGLNVQETDKSQEAPEIKSSSGSEEKNSQRTWTTSEAANTVNSVKNSQENKSLENNPVPTKTSNEDLSIATQRSSTENDSKSRKSRENYSQENTGSKLLRGSSEEQQRKSSEESNSSNNRGYPSLKKEQNQSQSNEYENNERNKNKLFVNSEELVNKQKKTSNSWTNRKNNLPSVNSQENNRNTQVKENQMQNRDNSKENVLANPEMSSFVQHQKRGYQNSDNSNVQKSISRKGNLMTVTKRINLAESQETSNEYPTIKRHQFLYSTSAGRSSQETWNQKGSQENNKQKLNNFQPKRNAMNRGAQSSSNSREEVNQNQVDSNEEEDQSYENRRGLHNKNQDSNIRLWSSNNRHEHHNKHHEHRHVKRSQNILNSQEEQLQNRQLENQKKQSHKKYSTNSEEQDQQRKTIVLARSEVKGQKQHKQNYGDSEEMQYPVSNMNNLQNDQNRDNLRSERKNNQQAQGYPPNNREQRMQANYQSNEEKSNESESSEELRGQSDEHKKEKLYKPLSKAATIAYNKYLAMFGGDGEINGKTRSQLNKTPKYSEEDRTNSNEKYKKNKNAEITVDNFKMIRDVIPQNSFEESVMFPFVYSMNSPMPMNARKMFMMSKSYMNNPLDYETANSNYRRGFYSSAAMARFHEALEESMKQNENTKMNSTKLITLNHYAVEEHNVTTDDGYILRMIRMSSPQNGTKKPVAFLMHGFLGSSDDWLLMGPKKALAYLLADAGYDVWLGNARGSKYSRQHIAKKPEEPEFWKFSNDEIALVDLPAMIDYALNTTQQKQMFYVGFSQGNAQFFALASRRPEYNAKIKIMYALSPMSFMKNSNSMLVKMFAPENPLSELITKYMQSHSKTGELKFQEKLLSLVGKDICMATIGCDTVCSNINFIMSGVNVEQIEPEVAAMILGHTPAGGSVRQMTQLGQATEDFRMFDYGIVMNQEVYGTSEPPSYNVKQVTAPVAMFSSKDDWLAATEDVEKLEAELPNVIQNYKIKTNYFTNLDFIYGKMATEMYNNIIKSMSGFEKHGLHN